MSVAAVCVLTSAKPKDQMREAFYKTNLDCENCAKKIRENVSFEKGVKDLKVEVKDKTVKVVYNGSKNDSQKLAKAIEKLGYKVEIVYDKAL